MDLLPHTLVLGDAMGYRVEYGSVRKVRNLDSRFSRKAAFTGMFLLLFLVLVKICWPQGSAILQEFFLPGNGAVTAAALDTFAEELRSGESLVQAFTAFCRQVLGSAGIG